MKSQREGFTLGGLVMALVIMAIIVTTLAGVTYVTARQALVADNAMARQAVALQTINRFATLPYANIAAAATPPCDTVGETNRRFETCVNLTSGTNAMIIQVVTTPLQHRVPPSSMQLVRSAPPSSNPLCMGC
ncbi:MAG TPA: hypothetical protein VFZ69_09170 [Longimicrobiales bacterium]